MRILFASMQYDRRRAQGTERYLGVLRDGLRALGHSSTILAGSPAHSPARDAAAPHAAGPPLRAGDPRRDDPEVLHYPTTGWMAVRGVAPARLREILRRIGPDLVHLVNPAHVGVGLIDAARAERIPVVVTVVDYWWLCPKHTLRHFSGRTCDARVTWRECLACIAAERADSTRRRIARVPLLRDAALPVLYFGRWLLAGVPPAEVARWPRRQATLLRALDRANAVIYLSDAAAALLAPYAPTPHAYRITNGLEPQWFATRAPARLAASQRAHSLDPAALTIGFAGVLAPHKGPHLLLEALAALGWNQTRVRLAGGADDQPYAESLRRAARGLNVEFLGPVRSEDMPAFLQSLDVLVVPSVWPENLPMVVLEAFAGRVPVLASRVDGITELVREPEHQFDVGSSSSLAQCLRRWQAESRTGTIPDVPTAEDMVRRTVAVYEETLRET
jgi:glycosyltransferase involved in cell wall biosynthesis